MPGVTGVCLGFLSVAKIATLTKRDCGVGAVLVSPYLHKKLEFRGISIQNIYPNNINIKILNAGK